MLEKSRLAAETEGNNARRGTQRENIADSTQKKQKHPFNTKEKPRCSCCFLLMRCVEEKKPGISSKKQKRKTNDFTHQTSNIPIKQHNNTNHNIQTDRIRHEAKHYLCTSCRAALCSLALLLRAIESIRGQGANYDSFQSVVSAHLLWMLLFVFIR